MNRLTIFIGICLLSLVGCTGGSPVVVDGELGGKALGNGAFMEHGVASAPSSTSVPVEVLNLLSLNLAPVNDFLPEIPFNDFPVKLPSDITEFWRDGDEPYLNSVNAIENGKTMELESIEGNPAWVIYQIPSLLPMTELIQLKIETSNPSFGGTDSGYWIGIANYAIKGWQLMAKTETTPYKSLLLPSSDPYLSDSGNSFYMFLALTGNQSMTVDRVGLEFNTPAWVEVIVDADTTDGISTGWMPSIVFNLVGNPVIAYAEIGEGKPRLAIGDRGAEGGLREPENWLITYIDRDPEDSGEAQPDAGAKVKWPDITIDEFNGMPRVSMIYDEIIGKEESSRAGLSVMAPNGQWLNFRLGWIDGAEWTSIDSIPGTPIYGLATSAKNTEWPSRDPYDFTYITFDISNSQHVFDLYRGFGTDWRFPHLKYNPGDGAGVLSVFGSSGYKEQAPDNWDQFFGDPNSNEFGSLAVNPVNQRFGGTYSQVNIGHWDLMYVEYDAGFVGSQETVDTLLRTNEVERIGDVSQLAYLPDGTPVIAYTVFDGSFVDIKYAQKKGAVWETQVISSEASLAETSEDRFVVDVAIDAAGVPAVCYRHRDTQGNNTLRVVFNEG